MPGGRGFPSGKIETAAAFHDLLAVNPDRAPVIMCEYERGTVADAAVFSPSVSGGLSMSFP
ncbi:hypothetical protein NIB75_06545 [Bacteroides uniformis]|nr:hypothetical protein [Bacteroides uniformis]